MDEKFRVEVLSRTENPQTVVYQALHTDYSETYVADEKTPTEAKCGEIAVNRLLKGGRGHWGPTEHPQIVFNAGYFPHSVMQQARTHRHLSFDVQCLAESTRIKKWNGDWITIKELFHTAPSDRPLLRSYCEKTGKFTSNPIADVFKSGVKKLYRMTLANGYSILASADHRFLSNTGWKRLHQLSVGARLVTNGVQGEAAKFYTDKDWLTDALIDTHPIDVAQYLGVSYEVIKKYAYKFDLTWKKRKTGVPKGTKMPKWSQHKDKFFTREHIRWWMKRVSGKLLKQKQCKGCKTSHNLVLHHIVPVDEDISQAYNANNLMPLCRSCHAKAHAPRLVVDLNEIIEITPMREGETYDISMGSSIHNFIAEGIVTHNSFRYTGERLCKASEGLLDIEDVVYLRPVGSYKDRQGNNYDYTETIRNADKSKAYIALDHYRERIREYGLSPEHARSLIPFDTRQHFVFSGNLRSIIRFLTTRGKRDAQLEIRQLCELMVPHMQSWCPEIMEWVMDNQWRKGRLAP